ncbi:MAG: hypothetical protein Q9M28_04780 [Mariprofundaceae bacterium]|nr:hypothetical protein [Mariprofundaceae bacterium]
MQPVQPKIVYATYPKLKADVFKPDLSIVIVWISSIFGTSKDFTVLANNKDGQSIDITKDYDFHLMPNGSVWLDDKTYYVGDKFAYNAVLASQVEPDHDKKEDNFLGLSTDLTLN